MIRKGIYSLIFASLMLILSIFAFMPILSTKAQNDNSLSRSDSNFSITYTGYRSSSNALTPTYKEPVQIIDDEHGRTVNYAYYNWSEIKFININIENYISGSSDTFVDFKLILSYKQTENWNENTTETRTIYEETINNNVLENKVLTFYIDEPEEIIENALYGDGFGIYKFDFVYSYLDSDSGQTFEKTLGDMYFAVVPDDIDTINRQISFDIETYSSDKFLNTYYISIKEDDYKYVNPSHIVWSVTGIGKDNTRYVMREADKTGEQDYRSALWPSYGDNNEKDTERDMYGNDFLFDSNDVEGRFDISCTIYDTEGNIITSYVTTVTTIKDETYSYLWLIIVLIILVLIVIAAIILIVVLRKKEKMW